MRIAFMSTRLAGTDGVSLETHKLAAIVRQMGHEVFYCAGELEGDVPGMLIPEIHFQDPVAVALGERAFGRTEPDPVLLAALAERAEELKRPLRQFLINYHIDYLVLQNIVAIPMQLPLAKAVADLMQELDLPGLAHSHDLYWERDRFLVNCIPDYLDTYFPPDLPKLRHAVINSLAQRALQNRRGLDSLLIPNVFDFATPAPGIDDYNRDFRQAIGLAESDRLILQPTRVIARKGIELAIETLARLADPRNKLVITHQAGDEGLAYLHRLQALAAEQGVDLRYVADKVDDVRRRGADGRKIYALWDTYPHADFVMYPSLIEGFGNALLELIYFRKPALVNRYAVYAADIGPLGFQFTEIDGMVTEEAVASVRYWLEDETAVQTAVDHNYHLALRHYSYETLAEQLGKVLPR
ncbi:MAG: glycosyltransferase family 4 protein [Chloroflexi bacterium]|nr:glycosyltransferase family 4 protein [Chloroflexota bacterium]MBP7042557.1 glycosyltransferase family 4 protein [Chloroflexota bacterium]